MRPFVFRAIFLATALNSLSFACKEPSSNQTAETGKANPLENATADTAGAAPPTRDYLAVGQNFAQATSLALQEELSKAMSEKGADGALAYCNTRANPITDSIAHLFNARIRRITDKPRNPDNKADDFGLAQIDYLRAEKAAGNPLGAIIMESDGHFKGYYPIVTNAMCLACHGQPGRDIDGPTLRKIKTLYPKDKAMGYGPDEVRGLWVVEFSETGTPKSGQ